MVNRYLSALDVDIIAHIVAGHTDEQTAAALSITPAFLAYKRKKIAATIKGDAQ